MKALMLLAGLVVTTGAVGQEPAAPAAPDDRFLARNDRDGDGRLDREEYRNFLARLFARRDADGDGRLGPGEHRQDGADLSREEFFAQAEAGFDRHDADGDGSLAPDELRAYRAAHRAKKED